jgi:threonine dehydratase
MTEPIHHGPITLEEIERARARIEGVALRTPLVRFAIDVPDTEIYLKLEVLQPIGSFKIRGAGSLIGSLSDEDLANGVWTASAGNMAQAVAWFARHRGLPCTAVMPDTAPEAKISAVERLGGTVIPVTFDEWLEVFTSRMFTGLDGTFVHPFSDRRVMAGNGTIGLEILEDLPEVDAVVIPYGGGGLSCGIASAIRARAPATRVYAAEVAGAAPLAPSLSAGTPVEVAFTPSFVDGIGAPRVFPEMFELARTLLDGSLVVEPDASADAVRLLATRAHVVAEGAGAVPGRGRDRGTRGPGQGRRDRVGREHRRLEAGDDPDRQRLTPSRYAAAVRVDTEFEPLETERLRLRRSSPEDAETISAYRSDPDVNRQQGWDRTDPVGVLADIVEMSTRVPGEPGGWVQFTVEEREGGRIVGDVGFTVADGEPNVIKVGYTIAPEFQGRGYATEAIRALVNYAFDALGAEIVRAHASAENVSSIRVAEKVGMRLVERVQYREGDEVWHGVRYEVRR